MFIKAKELLSNAQLLLVCILIPAEAITCQLFAFPGILFNHSLYDVTQEVSVKEVRFFQECLPSKILLFKFSNHNIYDAQSSVTTSRRNRFRNFRLFNDQFKKFFNFGAFTRLW